MERSRIVAVGGSLGGHTVGRLAGMRVTDPAEGGEANLIDPRLQAAVRCGAPGNGADLAAFASEHGRFGQTAEIAEAVAFLASPRRASSMARA